MGHWLRVNRRVITKVPEVIVDEAVYASQWRLWWAGLQPSRRSRDVNGNFLSMGSAEWDLLKVPGKNGVLTLLVSLSWWCDISTAVTERDRKAAVSDVAWVLGSMAHSDSCGVLRRYAPF